MFGTPENELDSIITAEMSSFIDKVHKDTKGGISDLRLSDSLDRIQVGLKIIPNMD